MKTASIIKSKTAWALALGLLAAQLPAQAAFCTVSDSGTPVLTTVNPKPFIVPPPSTCLVSGLPGSAGIPGYIQVASRTAPLKPNNVTVGTFYDRVYCLGSGTTCSTPRTYILASRVQMLPGSGGAACPQWSGLTTECYEINDIFRSIRTAATGVQVGYWMGSTSSGSDPNTKLAIKYLEYTGRTFQGLDPANPAAPRTRNNGKINFRTDINIFDPDGVNAPWSPWLYVKLTCPNGVITTNLTTNAITQFAARFRQGGEEGQIQNFVEQAAYACNN